MSRHAQSVVMPPEVIAAQPTKIAAIRLCIQASGLQDSEIALALDIDPGQLSKLLKGNGNFPNNKEHALMDLCGNEIPLLWDAMKRGKELKPLLSAVEQENVELRRELAEARREKTALIQTLREIRA